MRLQLLIQDYLPLFWMLVLVGGAYLAGSLSFAVLVSRCMGLADPRTVGSKNPGATNVLRSGNKKAAGLTLLCDALKAYLPMLFCQWLAENRGLQVHAGAIAWLGFAAFLGHLYPVFFKFKGGKGVATAFGVWFGLHWALGLVAVAVWLVVAKISRYSSLASMVTALSVPLVYVLADETLWQFEAAVVWMLFAMLIGIVARHRENLARLVQGTETRLKENAKITTNAPSTK